VAKATVLYLKNYQFDASSKTRSRFFEILTVRSAISDASSYGFWTNILVQSS